uniref:Uncharacterized protein n=1 Tax=Oryza meridionalis TaxID=40149 RepID=A0A0E0CNJ4_9ORYZ
MHERWGWYVVWYRAVLFLVFHVLMIASWAAGFYLWRKHHGGERAEREGADDQRRAASRTGSAAHADVGNGARRNGLNRAENDATLSVSPSPFRPRSHYRTGRAGMQDERGARGWQLGSAGRSPQGMRS